MSNTFLLPFQCPKPYTITEINSGISDIIESSNTLIWVEGEVSNFKQASSGHCYFNLKDRQSRIPAVIWRSNLGRIGFEPEDGMSVTVIASIRVYQQGGYYQLNVSRMNLSGRGELFAAFERLKIKLQKEGLFDPAVKKPLPESVTTLGIITSKKGAAVRDVIKTAGSRSPGTDILIRHVPVQGKNAPDEIASAIREMNTHKKTECIILCRGGGSVEDLQPFNNEKVARAIFESELPVISAIGHEIDFTIADFVADFRAPTPSASAEAVLRDDSESNRRLKDTAIRFVNSFQYGLQNLQNRFDRCKTSPAFSNLPRLIFDSSQRIDELEMRLAKAAAASMEKKNSSLSALSSRLNSLSPLSVMSRGYSIVSDRKNRLVKSAQEVKKNDKIKIKFYKGEADATIEHTES